MLYEKSLELLVHVKIYFFKISCNYTKKDVLETEQYEMLTGLVLSNLITSVDQTFLHPLIITEQKSFCTLDFS